MESWGRERFPVPTPEELLPVPAGPRSPPLSPGCATTRFSLPPSLRFRAASLGARWKEGSAARLGEEAGRGFGEGA